MTIIEKARELGVMIQQDERYIAYNVAREANDSDEELQQMINDFNLLRLNLNAEMSKPDKSSEKITSSTSCPSHKRMPTYPSNISMRCDLALQR